MSKKLNLLAKAYTLDALSHHNTKTAMEVMRSVNTRLYLEDRSQDHNFDWHEYSNYLQELEGKGLVQTAGITLEGMTRYQIAKIETGETK